jgi:LPXTG-motif cell wall-anchored protein
MNTKAIGLIILVIGFSMTLYTGFSYLTREKVLDLGGVELTVNKEHTTNWSPFIGIGIIAIGGIVFVSGKKK